MERLGLEETVVEVVKEKWIEMDKSCVEKGR